MAVTKQTYSAAATWTASQLADLYKNAFIDAGFMVDWFDSFLSGTVENRVLRVVYDNSKTFGTVYYWFMFTTTTVGMQTTLGWNATTHVPTGTLYLDYFSATTNSTANHLIHISTLANTTGVSLTRYTSAVNTACSWFLLANSTSQTFTFHVATPGCGPAAALNLDQVAFNCSLSPGAIGYSAGATALGFYQVGGHTRRTFIGAVMTRGWTSNSPYVTRICTNVYGALGNVSGSNANWTNGGIQASSLLMNARANTTGLATDYCPVYIGIQPSIWQIPHPIDFGIVTYYTNNLPTIGDKFIVTAGVEEWEILYNTSIATADGSRIYFMARVV